MHRPWSAGADDVAEQLRVKMMLETAEANGEAGEPAFDMDAWSDHSDEGADRGVDDRRTFVDKHEDRVAVFKPPSVYLLNVLHLSFCFFFVYTTLSAAQNYSSSLIQPIQIEGSLGNTTLGIMYLVYTMTCWVAPAAVLLLGQLRAMTIGFLAVTLYSVANILIIADQTNRTNHTLFKYNPRKADWIVLMTASVLVGLAASFVWTAQGVYLINNAMKYAQAKGVPLKDHMGTFVGIFYAVFQLTQITGNLGPTVLFEKMNFSLAGIMTLYTGMAVVGTLLSLRLGRVSSAEIDGLRLSCSTCSSGGSQHIGGRQSAEKKQGPYDLIVLSVQAMTLLWTDWRVCLITPLMIYTGLEQGFIWNDYTTNYVKPSVGEKNIGYVMAVFGIVDVIFSALLGTLSDRLGRHVIIGIGFLVQGGCVAVMLLQHQVEPDLDDRAWPSLLALAALWGIGDAAFNTQIVTLTVDLCCEMCPDDVVDADGCDGTVADGEANETERDSRAGPGGSSSSGGSGSSGATRMLQRRGSANGIVSIHSGQSRTRLARTVSNLASFANLKLWQSLGIATAFFYTPILSDLKDKLMILLVGLLIGLFGYVALTVKLNLAEDDEVEAKAGRGGRHVSDVESATSGVRAVSAAAFTGTSARDSPRARARAAGQQQEQGTLREPLIPETSRADSGSYVSRTPEGWTPRKPHSRSRTTTGGSFNGGGGSGGRAGRVVDVTDYGGGGGGGGGGRAGQVGRGRFPPRQGQGDTRGLPPRRAGGEKGKASVTGACMEGSGEESGPDDVLPRSEGGLLPIMSGVMMSDSGESTASGAPSSAGGGSPGRPKSRARSASQERSWSWSGMGGMSFGNRSRGRSGSGGEWGWFLSSNGIGSSTSGGRQFSDEDRAMADHSTPSGYSVALGSALQGSGGASSGTGTGVWRSGAHSVGGSSLGKRPPGGGSLLAKLEREHRGGEGSSFAGGGVSSVHHSRGSSQGRGHSRGRSAVLSETKEEEGEDDEDDEDEDENGMWQVDSAECRALQESALHDGDEEVPQSWSKFVLEPVGKDDAYPSYNKSYSKSSPEEKTCVTQVDKIFSALNAISNPDDLANPNANFDLGGDGMGLELDIDICLEITPEVTPQVTPSPSRHASADFNDGDGTYDDAVTEEYCNPVINCDAVVLAVDGKWAIPAATIKKSEKKDLKKDLSSASPPTEIFKNSAEQKTSASQVDKIFSALNALSDSGFGNPDASFDLGADTMQMDIDICLEITPDVTPEVTPAPSRQASVDFNDSDNRTLLPIAELLSAERDNSNSRISDGDPIAWRGGAGSLGWEEE
jgi:MFS family permease